MKKEFGRLASGSSWKLLKNKKIVYIRYRLSDEVQAFKASELNYAKNEKVQ